MHSTSPCASLPTDKAIYDAIRHGNEVTINKAAACLDSHKEIFYTYILNSLASRNIALNRHEKLKDIEEAYHDAMLEFIGKVKMDPPEFKLIEKGSIKSYVFKTGFYKYLDKVRAFAIAAKNKGIYKDVVISNVIVNLLEQVLKKERAGNIQQAIKELNGDCANLLDLRYNLGLTPKDIALLQDESANNISQKLLRCREKLKQLLIAKYGFQDSFV